VELGNDVAWVCSNDKMLFNLWHIRCFKKVTESIRLTSVYYIQCMTVIKVLRSSPNGIMNSSVTKQLTE
jgi:hypothetical protein